MPHYDPSWQAFTSAQRIKFDDLCQRFNADSTSTIYQSGIFLPDGWASFVLAKEGKTLLVGGIDPEGNAHT